MPTFGGRKLIVEFLPRLATLIEISAHLSDWTADKKEVPIGNGINDWKEFFISAKTGGVKNYFVEMDFDTFQESSQYFHGLQI